MLRWFAKAPGHYRPHKSYKHKPKEGITATTHSKASSPTHQPFRRCDMTTVNRFPASPKALANEAIRGVGGGNQNKTELSTYESMLPTPRTNLLTQNAAHFGPPFPPSLTCRKKQTTLASEDDVQDKNEEICRRVRVHYTHGHSHSTLHTTNRNE